MFNYLFGPLPGQGAELTSEAWLRAILVTYVFTTVLGIAIWIWSRYRSRRNPLAGEQLNRLGQAFFWVGLTALLVAGFFSQGALVDRRAWLWLMLLVVYAVIVYALYFYYTRYQDLLAAQRAEAARRKRYIPAPHTLGRTRTGRPQKNRSSE